MSRLAVETPGTWGRQEDRQMTGIAISRPAGNTARIAIAMLLVAVGIVAGFGLAKVVATVDLGQGSAQQTISLSAAPAYQAQRAGERDSLVPLSGNAGFQAQRAGERGSEAASGGSGLNTDDSWQLQRAGERGAAP
jgi:hypothetical protein